MINTQIIGIGITLIAFIAGAYFYHFKPISDLEERVAILEGIVERKDTTISNLGIRLRVCQDQKRVNGFNEYIEGLSNETNLTNHPSFTF